MLLAEATLVYGRVFAMAMVDPVLVGLIEESLAAMPVEDSSLRVRLMARAGGGPAARPEITEPVRVAARRSRWHAGWAIRDAAGPLIAGCRR